MDIEVQKQSVIKCSHVCPLANIRLHGSHSAAQPLVCSTCEYRNSGSQHAHIDAIPDDLMIVLLVFTVVICTGIRRAIHPPGDV